MNYDEAKKIVSKLNTRLKRLKTIAPTSYEYAKAQLEQIPGLKITDNGYIRIDKKNYLDTNYIDKILGSAENSVPTLTNEIKYIEKELASIDKRRLDKYGTAIPKRDKKELLAELKAKRSFDLFALVNGTTFEQSYEAWEDHDMPLIMTKRLINLERRITDKLGKGRKGIKTYAELYQIQILITAYLKNKDEVNDAAEEALIESAQLVNEVDLI